MNLNDSSLNMTTESMVASTLGSSEDGGGDGPDLYKIATDFFIAIDPIILAVGVLGNILSFFVMQRPGLKSTTVAVYLSALAVTDTCVLVLDFINNWFGFKLDLQLLDDDHHFCVFHRYIFDVFYTYAAWLVTAVGVERFIVVWFPLRAKTICTRRAAIWAVTAMPPVIMIIYCFNIWGWGIDGGDCSPHERMEYFQNLIKPWLTAVLYSYAPSVINIFTSTGIIVQLSRATQQRAVMSGKNDSSAADAEVKKITITVLSISITFLVLTVPLAIWYIVIFAKEMFQDQPGEIVLGETIVLVLALINHSINFFLYVMTSRKFRIELLRMLGFARFMPQLLETSKSMNTTSTTGVGKSVYTVADTKT